MRDQASSKLSGIRQILTVSLALITGILTMSPVSADAASAGNTIIRNKVSVSYNDASNNPQTAVTASVDITVTTVNAAPNIKSVSPSPGSTGATGSTQLYAVEIVTNSNGPGSISLSAADGTFNNIAAGTAPSAAGSPVFLGSTIIDPSDVKLTGLQTKANTTSITFAIPNDGGVPSDTATTGGSTVDGVVNGLKATDTVYIYSGTAYYGPFTVASVVENGVPLVSTGNPVPVNSITLTNNTGAPSCFTPLYGWMIVESKSLNVTVTQGVVTVPTNPASWITTFTGTMGGLNGTNTVTTNATSGLLTVTKYVRNVTIAVAGAGQLIPNPPINGGAATFYQSGVNGKPGDVLEYLYVISNTGTGTVKAVVATDAVPNYTTLRNSTTSYANDFSGGAAGFFARAYRTGNFTDQSLAVNDSLGNNATAWGKSIGTLNGTVAGSVMTFYLGNNCTSAAGGDLAPGEKAYVIYQLKID
jgi:hypothetical protein